LETITRQDQRGGHSTPNALGDKLGDKVRDKRKASPGKQDTESQTRQERNWETRLEE